MFKVYRQRIVSNIEAVCLESNIEPFPFILKVVMFLSKLHYKLYLLILGFRLDTNVLCTELEDMHFSTYLLHPTLPSVQMRVVLQNYLYIQKH